MSFDAKYPSAEVLRRLGVSDPRMYGIGSAPLQGTIQVLDLSRSAAAEPFEARGYKDLLTPLIGGSFALCVLHCRAPGGLVLESFVLEDPLPSGYFGPNQVSFTLTQQLDPTWTLIPAPGLDVGGLSVKSTPYLGYTLADRDPAVGNWEVTNNPALQTPLRLFLPSGSVFVVQNQLVSGPLQVALLWRELAEGTGL
jgi:hypothetical protein